MKAINQAPVSQKTTKGLTVLGALRLVDPARWEEKIRFAMMKHSGDVYAAAKELEVSGRQLFRILERPLFRDVERKPVGKPAKSD
jgi:ActR/RegA family two-component response regulator